MRCGNLTVQKYAAFIFARACSEVALWVVVVGIITGIAWSRDGWHEDSKEFARAALALFLLFLTALVFIDSIPSLAYPEAAAIGNLLRGRR